MEAKQIKRARVSAGLALSAAFVLMVFVLVCGDLWGDHFPLGEKVGEDFLYALWGISLAVACYFICRHNPKSIWYVPVLCNLVGITSAVIEPNFWITPMWIFVCGGWVLSIIGAIAGAKRGRKNLST